MSGRVKICRRRMRAHRPPPHQPHGAPCAVFVKDIGTSAGGRSTSRRALIAASIDLAPDANTFRQQHEQSRGWSPFNYALHARINRGTSVIGTAFGQSVEFDARGQISQRRLRANDRVRFLVDEIGIHEELAAMVPPDLPTPPPP